uniref:B30.2/SPRY domain-containing protein n=1 Tax=Poecilia reticulata TaxID=8081 RepID=A0A3P9QE02_POERE
TGDALIASAFLPFPAKITWDPNTAHPRLVFFNDNTEVSTTNDVPPFQDNPGRFDVVLGVLGSNGFSRGRHYWEVSVADKRCYHIGMVSESAKRKGSLSFRPAKGFWTITRLTYQMVGNRVAVAVDYSSGTITFSEVGPSNTLIHLHTFSTSFAQPVCLGFGLYKAELKSRISVVKV